MNKSEKIICIILGAILAWYIYGEMTKKPAPAAKSAAVANAAAAKSAPVANAAAAKSAAVASAAAEQAQAVATPSVPERTVTLANGELELALSSWGAVVKSATLLRYGRDAGAIGEGNPAVTLDFASAPLGALEGVEGLAANAAYEVRDVTSNSVVFVNAAVTRKVTLGGDYRVTVEDTFHQGVGAAKPMTLALGVMRMGGSKNDLLSVDSLVLANAKGKSEVLHHSDGDSPLKSYLVGGLGGGCSGCGSSPSAANMPAKAQVQVGGAQGWIAAKNRFFVTALCSVSDENQGFVAEVSRDLKSANYRPDAIALRAQFGVVPERRTSVFFIGPKRQSLLWDLGMKDVMEFGMWRWLCYPLVWVLNLFNDFIPNYGVAIILLTILVRVLFWPLTHKSTVGMRKMQEIQPLMKEIQAKYKDNPQRLQQETWALYKDHKVNPLSSCLPMLIQIPIFIALFNVLRSAVELRYAPFLWIADLSEPEALFASWFPFGGLNILPILMAVSTGLQSAFTPSAGDKSQQKMMVVFMPAMMLFMFYSFPSALSLYWFLSNLFSIVQMWLIRRQTAAKAEVIVPEVIDPPVTRQMRRHG